MNPKRQPSYFAKAIAMMEPGTSNLVIAERASNDCDYVTRALLTKAPVGPMTTQTIGATVEEQLAGQDFIAHWRTRTISGQLRSVRRIPYNVAVPRVIGTSSSFWVGEGAQVPVAKASIDKTIALFPKKNAITAVISAEINRIGGDNARHLIDQELTAAVLQSVDIAFIDPSNNGSASKPASILAGLQGLTSANDPDADIENLIAHFDGDLSTSVFIMSSTLAARLHLRRDTSGVSSFPFVGATGGEIAGVPVVVSNNVPDSTSGSVIALVDQTALLLPYEEEAEMRASGDADIAMIDNPSGATSMVSMWQANCIAVQIVLTTDWVRARDGGVVWMEVGY